MPVMLVKEYSHCCPGDQRQARFFRRIRKRPIFRLAFFCIWLREPDLNRRPSGYEPDELPGCSTPHQVLTMPLASTPVSSKAFTRNSGFATKGPATEGRESRESGVPRQGRNAQKRGVCDECWGPAKTQFCGRAAPRYRAISPRLDERNSVNMPVAAGNHIAN